MDSVKRLTIDKQHHKYIKKNRKTTYNSEKYQINNIQITMSIPENNQQKIITENSKIHWMNQLYHNCKTTNKKPLIKQQIFSLKNTDKQYNNYIQKTVKQLSTMKNIKLKT